MHESSKALMRRLHDSRFATRYFVGHGIDIGAGPDALSQYTDLFPLMRSCRAWDLKDGDAQLLANVDDASLDFVHSSHCLEHMRSPREALHHWLRVLKPGGHLIVTIPDEDLYEQGVFPSSFNGDHKWTFTMHKVNSWSDKSINLMGLLMEFADRTQTIKVEQLDATFRFGLPRFDQTLTPIGECALEFILRKYLPAELVLHGRLPPQQSESLTIEQTLHQAVTLHQSGQLQKAGELYQAILKSQPSHPEANHNLGIIAVQINQPVAGLPYFMAALDADPTCGKYWLNYIDALLQAGQAEDARQILALARQHGLQGGEMEAMALRLHEDIPVTAQTDATEPPVAHEAPMLKAAALSPNDVEAHYNLGITLYNQGRLDEAEASYQRVLQIRPDLAEAHYNLGIILKELGRLDEAEASYQRALQIKPDYADAHYNLGIILKELGRLNEAETCYRRVIQIKQDYAEAHSNLGITLQALGRLNEAETSYRRALHIHPDNADAHGNLGVTRQALGRLDEAETSCRRALQIQPDDAEAHNNLGAILLQLGRPNEAEDSCRRALQIHPDFAEAHNNLGITLRDMGRLDEAEACYRRALQIKPDYAKAYNNLGLTLQDLGRLDEAEACYRQALQIKPDYFDAHSNLLFSLNYAPSQTPSRGITEARQYGQNISRKVTSQFTEWPCAKSHERLRVGFVSGDFNDHPVGYFLESLLRQLGTTAIELIAYPTDHKADELTARIKPRFAAWAPLLGLNDEAAAQRIHSDGVHILIDLSGHTRHNRLPLFAWKPAPVQVSWLGYFATTGVAEIDYLIADPWTLPEREEAYFTEKIWRLPETRLCFTPPDIDLEVSALPALKNGHITFGCFNNLTKMNDEVVALWSRVLAAVPGSRLFLKASQLRGAAARQHVIERFAGHGIEADRLILEGAESREKYLAAYQRVDIALDPFPFPGGTTSAEALWMGVPVVTLAGERFLSRQGIGILMNAGLADWVSNDVDDYVARAASHAGSLQELAKLRDELRQQVLASPLMDAQRFSAHFVTAMRSMYQTWITKRQE